MAENFNVTGLKRSGQLLDPTREQLVRIWWTFWWPTASWSISTKILDFYQQGGDPSRFSGVYHRPFVMDILGIAISVWAMWRTLNRQYPDFRLALISSREVPPRRVLLDVGNAARVYWAFLWRGLLWAALCAALVFLPVFFKNLATPYWGLSLPGWLYMDTLFSAVLDYFILQHYIIDREFGHLQVRLMPLAQSAQANAAAPAPTA